jgi:hypothetical protein
VLHLKPRSTKDAHAAIVMATEQEVRKVLVNLGRRTRKEVPRGLPRPGNVPKKTKTRILWSKRRAALRVSNRAKQARILEHGSRAHVIRARRARFLRFRRGGQTVFRRAVFHPGTRPYRFLDRALQSAATGFDQRLARALRRALHRR